MRNQANPVLESPMRISQMPIRKARASMPKGSGVTLPVPIVILTVAEDRSTGISALAYSEGDQAEDQAADAPIQA